MKIASLFKYGNTQAVLLPKEFEFVGATEVQISRNGDTIVLKPIRKPWTSLIGADRADEDFLSNREDVIEEHQAKPPTNTDK